MSNPQQRSCSTCMTHPSSALFDGRGGCPETKTLVRVLPSSARQSGVPAGIRVRLLSGLAAPSGPDLCRSDRHYLSIAWRPAHFHRLGGLPAADGRLLCLIGLCPRDLLPPTSSRRTR